VKKIIVNCSYVDHSCRFLRRIKRYVLLENVWNKIQDTKDTIEVDYHEIERLFFMKNNTTLRVNTRREVNTLFMTICYHRKL
jgi:hypothetical protein